MAKPRPQLHLPELRRRLRPLAGQVRGLRRVEHDRRGRRRRSAAPVPGARRRARAASSRSSRCPARPQEAPRLPSGIAELDRVTGGGFVRGSVLLIGGDPGIGKSTLLIQAAAALARSRPPRRSTSRARKRSRRCGCAPSGSASPTPPVELAAETSVEDIIATLSSRARRRASSSSIRSRPCGPTPSNPRPAR